MHDVTRESLTFLGHAADPPHKDAAEHGHERGRRVQRRVPAEVDHDGSGQRGTEHLHEALLLLGHSTGHVGQSLWLEVCHGRREGKPPPVDLALERRLGELVRQLIDAGLVSAAHDISDGGALVAIAEMALAGSIGARLTLPTAANPSAVVFCEDQGRILVTTSDPDAVAARAGAANIYSARVGETGGDAVEGPGFSAGLEALRAAHEGFFPKLMGSELTPEF